MKIKPTSTYEGMLIYYTVDNLSFVLVSATCCGHFQEGVFQRIYYRENQNRFKNVNYYVLSINFKIYVKP